MLGPDQRAVEVVDPGVVRALEADDLAARAPRRPPCPRWRQTLWNARSSPSRPRTMRRSSPSRVDELIRAGLRRRPPRARPAPSRGGGSRPAPSRRWPGRGRSAPGSSEAPRYSRRTEASSAAVRIVVIRHRCPPRSIRSLRRARSCGMGLLMPRVFRLVRHGMHQAQRARSARGRRGCRRHFGALVSRTGRCPVAEVRYRAPGRSPPE